MNDTIAAISTSLGVGAISIIRVSGKDSIKIVNQITKADLTNKKTHTITYTHIIYNNELIDEVLISIMKAPRTFTTEDIVEINCHGGIATTKKILEILLKIGCRMAENGEFTKRAFLNGRIDLTQAEAIMDLINAKSEAERKISMNNLEGKTNKKIKQLRKDILNILTNIEVNIDYPEYLDIEEMTKEKISQAITNIENELNIIVENSKNTQIIKNGINISILGHPNVGKSSILNKLIGEEKAIVTDEEGTTRDIVEASINLDGTTLNFIDTAGIRETKNKAEKIGIEKSIKQIEASDLVIVVFANNEDLTTQDKELLEKTKDKKRIVVINKNDLETKINKENLDKNQIIYTNTVKEEGIDNLKLKIKEMFNTDKLEQNNYNYISNIEQLNKLEQTLTNLTDLKKGLNDNLPIDILEIDLKQMWELLGEIIGETYEEELLDALFKDFCVGK